MDFGMSFIFAEKLFAVMYMLLSVGHNVYYIGLIVTSGRENRGRRSGKNYGSVQRIRYNKQECDNILYWRSVMLKKYFRLKTAQIGIPDEEGYKDGVYETFIATNPDETKATHGNNAQVYYRISRFDGDIKISKIFIDGFEMDLDPKRLPPQYLENIRQEILGDLSSESPMTPDPNDSHEL